ncbi:MAG: hypothetical protein O4751_02565 [Trichodesmium sp. St2_bin6]|nr:hypothetical protein [Trichodesmium sp. St5_bin8]MDE5077198.1 hypothetical protein [Trichodesmium sp. St2_bin6]MDE5102366.1 hypothetical protein [Trichodesmium sp. St19_bin2]
MANSEATPWSIFLHNYLKNFYDHLIFHLNLFFKGLRILFPG